MDRVREILDECLALVRSADRRITLAPTRPALPPATSTPKRTPPEPWTRRRLLRAGLRTVAAAAVPAALTGGDTVPRVGTTGITAIGTRTRWSRSITAVARDVAVEVKAGAVYVVDDRGLRVFTAADGAERWRRNRRGDAAYRRCVVGDDTVFVKQGPGFVAIDTLDGTTRWESSLEYGYMAEHDGVVYVFGRKPANGSAVFALDARSGQERWFHSSTDIGALERSHGAVYMTDSDGKLYCVDETTGERRWEADVGGLTYGPPLVTADSVYVPNLDGRLYALDATTGHPRWNVFGVVPDSPKPLLSGDHLFILSFHPSSSANRLFGVVSAVDVSGPRMGEERVMWNASGFPSLVTVVLPAHLAPRITAETLCMTAFGRLLAIDTNLDFEPRNRLHEPSNHVRWEHGVGDAPGAPIVVDEMVYVGGRGGMDAFDLVTGVRRWRVDTGGMSASLRTVTDGTVFVVIGGRYLYAFDA